MRKISSILLSQVFNMAVMYAQAHQAPFGHRLQTYFMAAEYCLQTYFYTGYKHTLAEEHCYSLFPAKKLKTIKKKKTW